MKIPFIDLKRQYAPLKDKLTEAFQKTLQTGNFILGDEVLGFEKKIGEKFGFPHVIGVSSGTDALWLALRSLGVSHGDEVITSPFTFFATCSAILQLGARPVFVDIDQKTFHMDPKALEKYLNHHHKNHPIKAILPVHLFGHMAPMDEICDIAHFYQLPVVEDAAQALGSTLHQQQAGSFGDVSAFSFFPTKNLGALGDGGMVTTKNEKLATRIRLLRTHGSQVRYYHEMLGGNFRLDALQASFLSIFMDSFDNWVCRRQQIAKNYNETLEHLPQIATPTELASYRHTYHQYTLFLQPKGAASIASSAQMKEGENRFFDKDRDINLRDRVIERLSQQGVSTAVYYPRPCHLQRALRHLNFKEGQFPIAESVSERVLSLPIFPSMTDEEILYVANALKTSLQ